MVLIQLKGDAALKALGFFFVVISLVLREVHAFELSSESNVMFRLDVAVFQGDLTVSLMRKLAGEAHSARAQEKREVWDDRLLLLVVNSRVVVGGAEEGRKRPVSECLAPAKCVWPLPERCGAVWNIAAYAVTIDPPGGRQTAAELLALAHLDGEGRRDFFSSPGTSTLPNSSAAVGLFYSGWHAYASQTVTQQVTPQPPLTVEQIIQSNGGYTIEDMYQTSTAADAMSFYYQHEPQTGFYCLYRKRANETTGVLPDCSNINGTARYHARLMVAAGIDYVALDSTNLPSYSPFADVIQLRPAEVLCEEWFALRQQGISTPAVAVWAAIPTGANLYAYFLSSIYNNVNLSTVVARDPATSKMIFFVVENPSLPSDASIFAAIESNGGRNNIICVRMWANFPQTDYSSGLWGFQSPCTDQGKYTTSVSDLPACGQRVTIGSSVGNAITVTPSYQLNYGSVPFGAAGKLGTDTFRMQWQTAIAQSGNIQHIFMSSFNEFIAQPQPNSFPQPHGVSMGLEWDPARVDLWVDSFGCHLSRDIEPSVQCGNATYEMMLSCVRTMTLANYLLSPTTLRLQKRNGNDTDHHDAIARQVAMVQALVVNEACAARTGTFLNVWSLVRTDKNDYLITTSATELNVLLNSQQWNEICNGFAGPTQYCVDQTVLTESDGSSGPFLLSTVSLSEGNALYRCRTSGGTHFFTNQGNCEGQILDNFLGYTAGRRSSDYPRSLRRCYRRSNGAHYHSLDFPCASGDTQEAMYGYVH